LSSWHFGGAYLFLTPSLKGYLRKRVKSEWTYKDLSERCHLVESDDKKIVYVGWAVKKERSPRRTEKKA
jgi:hypothetical protein